MFAMICGLFMLCFMSLFNNYSVLCSSWHYIWSWDIFSSSLTTLTLWMLILICLTESNYLNVLQILGWLLIILFNVKHTFIFFTLFEASILPILWIILMKGKQPERLVAGGSLLMYTFSASAGLFWGLLLLIWKSYCCNFLFTCLTKSSLVFFMILTFLVKLPMWSFHQWLPKAHVEAPVGGSMILASILLKLGIYGLYRFLSLTENSTIQSLKCWSSIGLIGMVMASLASLFMSDLKMIIAYSSVSHLSPSLLIISNYNSLSLTTIVALSLSHGFVSSFMFWVAHLVYTNSKTRLLLAQKGLLLTSPLVTLCLGWMLILNMAMPPFFPFYSEVSMLISLLSQSFTIMPVVVVLVIVSGAYNLMLFVGMTFGKDFHIPTSTLNSKELLVFALHVLPCVSFWMLM